MPRVKVSVPVEPAAQAQPATTVITPPAPETPPAPQPIAQGAVLPRQRRFTNQQLLVIGFSVLLLILLWTVISLARDRSQLEKKVSKLSSSATSSNGAEIEQLTAQIGQYFQLPAGEKPTLATVTDVNKVRDQAFFKDAQNGDKVLLYAKAGEAVLYRPSTKKIITVAPVNLNSNSGTTTPSVNQP